ncbi:MAG: hypothetical protein JRH10_20345 [Deltaproteobacteria bacterium]|nr:hypothetical protein [Deltaproteobacteria bacterium]
MNHEITFHEEEAYVEAKAVGPASVDKTRLLLTEIISQPGWSPEFCVLLDLAGLETDRLDAAEIREISDVFRAFGADLGTGCCAVVTARTVDYGLARMWQTMTEDDFPLDIRIFRSLPEAESWIRGRNERVALA